MFKESSASLQELDKTNGENEQNFLERKKEILNLQESIKTLGMSDGQLSLINSLQNYIKKNPGKDSLALIRSFHELLSTS